ncbi:MAG: hypothetical protein IIB00_10600, partial [candidate division Zixibacteria bacterium]|nr:hypothetical protein [candidate division Zixibacteria bacterium]
MRVRFRLTKLDFGLIGRIFTEFGDNLRAQRSKLILSGLYALGVTLMTLAQPWPIKIALDYILIPSNNLTTTDSLAFLNEVDPMFLLAIVAGMVMVIAALRGIFNYGQETLMKAAGHRIVGEIRLRVFAHIQRLPQSYHDYRETGELMTRLTGDMSLLR